MTFKKIPSENFEDVRKIADKMMKVFNVSQLYDSEEDLRERMMKFYTKLEVIEFMERKTFFFFLL